MNYPWIAKQRELNFRIELNDKNVWISVAAMMLSEGSPLQSVESLMNRVMYMRSAGRSTSLMDMIKSGFYGPWNRGEYPAFIARIRASQTLVDQMNTAIEQAMAGSDTIQGYTDQGLPADPNGQHQPQIHIGGNIFNDWGGGPGGHEGAAAWRNKFEAAKTTAPPAPAPAPVPTPTPTPIPTPTPPPALAPQSEIDAIIAILQASGKLPKPTITITIDGDATLVVNGKTVT